MAELSVIIPARNEEWLNRTVQDVLSNIEADTEIIVILDGAWPKEPLDQHERVHVVYVPESIGQRGATNLGARISKANYVMKLDAHCSMGRGFDRLLIEAATELGPDVTQIPAGRNLHVYDRVCNKCGRREYQGSPSAPCAACDETNWTIDVKWKPRGGTTKTRWSFDSEPKFQYGGAKEYPTVNGIHDTMSSLGACFFMRRDRFWQLGGLDNGHGSWGNFGVEVGCKSWLSGGRQVCNTNTSFSHFFRVGGVGFPYPISGADQDRARKYSRDLWFNNKWEGQVRPLSWLVEYFWPLSGWSDSDREFVLARGKEFGHAPSIVSPVVGAAAGDTDASALVAFDGNERTAAVAAGSVDILIPDSASEVFSERDELQMGRVTATPISAEMVELRKATAPTLGDGADDPCINEAVDQVDFAPECQRSIAAMSGGGPQPASDLIDSYFAEYATDGDSVQMGNGEILGVSHASASTADVGSGAGRVSARFAPSIIPSNTPTKSIIYYSDCAPDQSILEFCQKTIEWSGLPIIAVTLKPMAWAAATNVVLPIERSYIAMFRQILTALKLAESDVVYFCEHDVAYHPSHFEFTPPNSTQVYYNENVWKVNADTGHALHYLCSQTSGLCGDRQLLLEHYQKRVAIVQERGFSRKMGFEPGTHRRSERVDDLTARTWSSEYPNVDIRHGHNLTPSRWKKEQFRDQRYTKGWTEADCIPGWGVTKGRFREFMRESLGAQQAVA